MEKLTAAAASKDFENMVKLVTEENKVYQIEFAQNSAVLISYKEYESLQETIKLLSIPELRESLQKSLEQIKNIKPASKKDEIYENYRYFGST